MRPAEFHSCLQEFRRSASFLAIVLGALSLSANAAGPRWGYVFAASCGFVAVIVCLSGLALSRSLRAA